MTRVEVETSNMATQLTFLEGTVAAFSANLTVLDGAVIGLASAIEEKMTTKVDFGALVSEMKNMNSG